MILLEFKVNWSLSFLHKISQSITSNIYPLVFYQLYLFFELLEPWKLVYSQVNPCLFLDCKSFVSHIHNRLQNRCYRLSMRFRRYWYKRQPFWFLKEFSKKFLLDLHYSMHHKADTWSCQAHLFLLPSSLTTSADIFLWQISIPQRLLRKLKYRQALNVNAFWLLLWQTPQFYLTVWLGNI